MINKIAIKNFKSLKNLSFCARQLNLLCGLNGMGKSSFLQSMLLLKQSDGLRLTGQLNLRGLLTDIGKGKDALYQFAEDDMISFSFEFSNDVKAEWSFRYKPEWELLDSISGSTKNFDPALLKNLHYLSADRLGPQSLYEMSQPSVENDDCGTKGEFAAHYLQLNGTRLKINEIMKNNKVEDLSLLNQVNAWLGEISPGVRVNINEVPGVDKMILTYDFEMGYGRTASFKPSNVGFGISFSLSVILTLLSSRKESIIIIENPEAHIHPRGQAKLGKLLALCASCGAQIFVETHSDHIINGVRVAVKEQLMDRDNVLISWFEKETTRSEQFTRMEEIFIDHRGELSKYPEDFMDEWNNQLLKLV
jgi:predicted ATPase